MAPYCDRHDPAETVLYHYRDGRTETRCLACRRERSGYTTRQFSPTCRRGHVKTPWTWKRYGCIPTGRCMPCQKLGIERRKQA